MGRKPAPIASKKIHTTHDHEKIANDLLAWAEKDDSINFNHFCGYYRPYVTPTMITGWAAKYPNFSLPYEVAKCLVAARREQWLSDGRLHPKAYDICAAAYDGFIKHERREQAEYESELRQKEKSQLEDKPTEALSELLDRLRADDSEKDKEIAALRALN